MIKQIIQASLKKLGFKIVRYPDKIKDPIHNWDVESRFIEVWDQWKHLTGEPWQAYYTIWEAARYIVTNELRGSFVECGVQNGVGSIFMGEALAYFGSTDRNIYCYDTFTGMSEPSQQDFGIDGIPAKDILSNWPERNGIKDFCYGPYDEVVSNIERQRYPFDKYIFIRGKVEDTIPQQIPKKIALLKLDTDWYESTKHELEHLYPLLVSKGIIILDDYGCWHGARKAADDYFLNKKRPFFVLDSPHGSRVGQKV